MNAKQKTISDYLFFKFITDDHRFSNSLFPPYSIYIKGSEE